MFPSHDQEKEELMRIEEVEEFPNALSLYRLNPIGRYMKATFSEKVEGTKYHKVTLKK